MTFDPGYFFYKMQKQLEYCQDDSKPYQLESSSWWDDERIPFERKANEPLWT